MNQLKRRVKADAVLTGCLLPWSFFGIILLFGEIGDLLGLGREMDSSYGSGFFILLGLASVVITWRPLRWLMQWGLAGAGIPVTSTQEVGIKRLGHVIGLLFTPTFLFWLYSSHGYMWLDIEHWDRFRFPAFAFVIIGAVGPGIVLYLGLRLLVRTAFWIRDGFSVAEGISR